MVEDTAFTPMLEQVLICHIISTCGSNACACGLKASYPNSQSAEWQLGLFYLCSEACMPVLIDMDIVRTLLNVVEWLGCSGLYFCDRPVWYNREELGTRT